AGAAEPVYAGQTAVFKLYLEPAGRARQQLYVGFAGQAEQCFSLEDALGHSRELQLHAATAQRGMMAPGRLQLRSYFPLGLLRCWALLGLDWQCLVYPRPQAHLPLTISGGSSGDSGQDLRGESDELS